MERWYEPKDDLSIFDRLRRPLVSHAPDGVIADDDLARQLVDDRSDAVVRILQLEAALRRIAALARQLVDDRSDAVVRILQLEAALRRIAAPTYGTELHDTDAERASVYWGHLQRAQQIAREALGETPSQRK